MVNGIKSIIEDLKNNIKKEDIEKNIEFTSKLIKNEIIPSLDLLINSNNKALSNNTTIANFGRMCNLRGNTQSIMKSYKEFYLEVDEFLDFLDSFVDKKFPSIVTEATVTGLTGSIVKLVSDLSAMSNYILDFLNYALSIEANDGSKLSRIQIERIKTGMSTYMVLYKNYTGSLKKIEQELPNVSNEILNFDQPNLGMLNVFLNKTGKIIKLPTSNGFVGNPFYHIRLWMMDREIEKFEADKERKRLLELKVLALNMDKEVDGVDLNKINKQIEYYEEKIQDLEYKISKFQS